MNKQVSKLLTFFISTIIVVLIFVSTIQQTIFISDTDSPDTLFAKTELQPSKIGVDPLPLFFIPDVRHVALVLDFFIDSIPVNFLPKLDKKLICINNNSPPKYIYA